MNVFVGLFGESEMETLMWVVLVVVTLVFAMGLGWCLWNRKVLIVVIYAKLFGTSGGDGVSKVFYIDPESADRHVELVGQGVVQRSEFELNGELVDPTALTVDVLREWPGFEGIFSLECLQKLSNDDLVELARYCNQEGMTIADIVTKVIELLTASGVLG